MILARPTRLVPALPPAPATRSLLASLAGGPVLRRVALALYRRIRATVSTPGAVAAPVGSVAR